VDINTTIDLLQNPVAQQQFIESEQNIAEGRDAQFDHILAKEIALEPKVLKFPSQELPMAGNELPLDLTPSVTQEQSLEEVDIKPQLITDRHQQNDEKIEAPENVDLSSFLMTRFVIEPQSGPLQLQTAPTHKALQMGSLNVAADFSLASSPMILNESTIQINQMIASEQEDTMVASLPLEPLQEVHDEEPKLALNDKSATLAEYQAIKLISEVPQKTEVKTSDFIDALQIQLEQNAAKMPEIASNMFEFKSNEKVEVSIDTSEAPLAGLALTKEPLKQTMTLPNTGQFDENFSQIFEQKLMDNVNWMVRRNENATQIQIDPPELGKIEISIEQNDDKTDIRFYAQIDQTRQLIENTLDKLKLQFAQSGMELGQVDVNSGNQEAHSQDSRLKTPVYHVSHDEPTVNTIAHSATNQLIDLYI